MSNPTNGNPGSKPLNKANQKSYGVQIESTPNQGAKIVVGDSDSKIRFFDFDGSQQFGLTNELEGHLAPVKTVKRLGEDLLVSGCASGTAKIWNLKNMNLLGRCVGHRDQVVALDVHKNEPGILVTGGWDQKVLVFNLGLVEDVQPFLTG